MVEKKNMSNVLWKYQWFPFYSYRYDALDEMVFNFSELSIFNGEHRHPVQTREKKNSYTKILNAITSIYDEHISNVFQFEWIEWAHFYRMCLNREILDLLPRLVRTKNKHIVVFDTLEWLTHRNEKNNNTYASLRCDHWKYLELENQKCHYMKICDGICVPLSFLLWSFDAN